MRQLSAPIYHLFGFCMKSSLIIFRALSSNLLQAKGPTAILMFITS